MNPRNRSRAAALGAVALVVAAFSPVWASDPVASPVTLRWALGAWAGDEEPAGVKRDTRLEAGTRLKFLVEPTSPATVYLLLLDTGDQLTELYRGTPDFRANAQGEPTYIPPGSQYFELDDAQGVDTFFLLASAQPLGELEGLLDRHAAGSAAEQAELVPAIISEIRKQHKAHREFSRPVEKPVLIGGQTRGDGGTLADAIDRLALDVTSDGFYSKTITIEH